MNKSEKFMDIILNGTSDANIEFKQLCSFLKRMGFDERIKGDHHIFSKFNVAEIINLQPIGTKAKIYQVKQVRNIIIKYHLGE